MGLSIAMVLLLAAPAAAQAPAPAGPTYDGVLDELRKLAPRDDRAASVNGLVLQRDAAEFRLLSGTLRLLSPVAGRTIGAVFTGSGTVTFAPPVPMERAELLRVLHDSLHAAPITAAVFLFTDSTAAELERRVAFAPEAARSGGPEAVGAARDFLIDGGAQWVEPTLMTALLNDDPNGFFAAYVKRQRGEDLMVEIDPQEIQEVRLLRRGKVPGQRTQIVSQFDRAEDLRDSVAAADEHPEPFQLEAYRIEATIRDNFGFSALTAVRLRARRGGQRWAAFRLFSELEVDSVTGERGAPLAFFRPRRGSALWVRFEPAVGADRTVELRVAYHGDLIGHGSLVRQFLPNLPPQVAHKLSLEAMDRWAFIKSTSEWFPRYGSWQSADMELIFHTPAVYHFASIGRLVDSGTVGKVRTSRWVSEAPTSEASFNIGDLEEFEIRDPRIPTITVQINRQGHREMPALFGLAQHNPETQVGSDVANSLRFFTNAFGPPLFSHYYATEIPYGHGQAFPGLIHLSWWTFQSVSESGEEEAFRAHEMAHQWWGIGVEPADDRDAWLSEGFADFAGLWYMQLILQDNEKYFRRLGEWAGKLRAARDDAPPIGIGYRVLQLDPEHYELIVYRKGAWIVHMLRNLMINFNTMDEEPFRAMMRDFYTTYRGRRASTRDFQRVVERHVGLSMDWFFDEWVYGTAIPTYTLSWHATPAPEGKFDLEFRVRQEHVPAGFFMPVPLQVQFADSSRIYARVNVRGDKVEGKLRLPARPVRLELNPLRSVLAEVREEGWR